MLHLILLSYLHVTSDLFVCLSASASLFIVVGFLLFLSCTSLSKIVQTPWYYFLPFFVSLFFFCRLRLPLSGHVSGVRVDLIATNYWWLISSFHTHEEPTLATCAASDCMPGLISWFFVYAHVSWHLFFNIWSLMTACLLAWFLCSTECLCACVRAHAFRRGCSAWCWIKTRT